jgi:hypothetical protein
LQSQSSGLTRGFYQAFEPESSPMAEAIAKAGIAPGRPSARLNDIRGNAIDLPKAEQTALKMARGQTRERSYLRVLAQYGPNWERLPQDVQHDLLTRQASRDQSLVTTLARVLKARGQTLTLDALMAGR